MASYQLHNPEAECLQQQEACSPRYFSVPLVMPPSALVLLVAFSQRRAPAEPIRQSEVWLYSQYVQARCPLTSISPAGRQVCRRPGD